MTVSALDTKETFLGDGTTTIFSFGFKVDTSADLLVFTVATTGTETPLVLDTDYTVVVNTNQNSNPGGYIVLTTAIAENVPLVIMRGMDFTRGTEFTNSVPPHIIESELDRLVMYLQQLREQADRSLRVGPAFQADPDTGYGSIPLRAGKVVGFDDEGQAALYSFVSGSLVGPAGPALASRVEFNAPAIFRQASDGTWSHASVTATFIWTSNGTTVATRNVVVTRTGSAIDDPGLAEPGDEFTSTLVGTELLNITSAYNGQREYAQFALVAMPSDAIGTSDDFTPAWGSGEFTVDPVGAVTYAERAGMVTLFIDSALVAESATGAMTWDAGSIPAAIRPTAARGCDCVLQYNDTTEVQGRVVIATDGSAVFTTHVAATQITVAGVFQTGQDKGLPATWAIHYSI